MTRMVLYVAHPLAPTPEEIEVVRLRIVKWQPGGAFAGPETCAKAATADNAKRALRWLAWLRRSFPETTFIAPWIAAVMSGEDDADPEAREAGLVDDCAVVERCDGIVLCGGRISSGMRREMEHGIQWMREPPKGSGLIWKFAVYDLTKLGGSPPAYERDPVQSMDFQTWYQIGRQQYEAPE